MQLNLIANDDFVTYLEETPVNMITWRKPVDEVNAILAKCEKVVPDTKYAPYNVCVDGKMWFAVADDQKVEPIVEKKTRRKKVAKE